MKTKVQKEKELEGGRKLWDKSGFLFFADLTKVDAVAIGRLRRELKNAGAALMVVKKRLLNILAKERGAEFDAKKFGGSLATIFSPADAEKISGPLYKFFSSLEVPEGAAKDIWLKQILGGYDLKKNSLVAKEEIIAIGKLPPRETLLAQLLYALAAPISSLLYVLRERSAQRSQSP